MNQYIKTAFWRPALVLEDNLLKYTLIFSLVIHVLLMAHYSYLSSHQLRKSVKAVEVVYYNAAWHSKTQEVKSEQEKKEISKQGSSKGMEVSFQRQKQPPSFVKDMSKLSQDFQVATVKQPVVVVTQEAKRKVSVPVVKSEKINNPVYQDYYQMVRSKIKERAYANYSESDMGEVYLTFVILSDGSLKQFNLVDEKTSANDYLKNISLKSIQESSPFSPFPKDLSYPELSFNVVISFEVEE